jgi:hypothetical protein
VFRVHRIRSLLLCLLAVLFTNTGCSRALSVDKSSATETYVTDAGSVPFDLEPLDHGSGGTQFVATYRAQGKTARFRIYIGPATALGNTGGIEMTTGQGRFEAQTDSDGTIFLAALKTALEAKAMPARVVKAAVLPFTFVNLGENQSQTKDGGFSEKPRGNWTTMKLFFGEGDQESEVFLTLNSEIRMGQFSIKDPDYGDMVLAELAKIL